MQEVGWIKLHRSLLSHPVAQDPHAWLIWTWLLVKANYEPTRKKLGKSVVEIERGELFCTQAEIVAWSGLGRIQVRRVLDFLIFSQQISQRTSQLGTIITIINYDKYQAKEKTTSQRNSQRNSQRPANDQPTTSQRPANAPPPKTDESPVPTGFDSIIGNECLKKERRKEGKNISLSPIGDPPAVAVRPSGQDLIAHYCDGWKVRYGELPPINGPAAGAAKQILKAIGLERAKEYVTAYLAMNDQWFLTRHHDLPTLAANLNKVTTFLTNGRAITTTTAKRMEVAAENDATIERFLQRKGLAQ